jgi:hypothetical protein
LWCRYAAGLIGTLKPIPSVLPHPDKKNPVQVAEETRVFSSEAGVATVFVTRPSPNLVCRVCKVGLYKLNPADP